MKETISTANQPERRFIYVLIDPVITSYEEIFYVGQTADLLERFNQHCKDRSESAKCERIEGIIRRGRLPIMRTVCWTASTREADFKEAYYIEYYRELGHPLTNRILNFSGNSYQGTRDAVWEKFEREQAKRNFFLKLVGKMFHSDQGEI
jgi:predicted GIY-YIG superfamily endonuclease